ncbi:hypothetical protein H4S04_002857 [Coemansia sp. S16]|nr:hypothetical protein H4S04_002857 [Coemansia sp. S16]
MNPISPSVSSDVDGAPTRGNVLLYVILIVAVSLFLTLGYARLRAMLQFAYNCFLKPLGRHSSQQGRLDAFYEGQAAVYDSTRGGLLRGRKTMLRLCAAELKKRSNNGAKPTWIDLGGGTGWNIEQMDLLYGLSNFEQVYLVDLCRPLCKVAEQRFQAKGWKNVKVICQDALSFVLPELAGQDRGQINLVTMSYSLSMIEDFYPVVDRIASLLNPQTGFIGVADFYVSGAAGPSGHRDAEKAGVLGYQCNWFTRVFWQHWFEFDHVYLHPCRRNYLEHKFATHKALNCRNHFIVPYLIQMPYYVWLGQPTSAVESAPLQLVGPVSTHSTYAMTGASPPSSPDLPPVVSPDYATPSPIPKQMQRSRSTIAYKSDINLGPSALSTLLSSNVPRAASSSRGWTRLPYQPTKPEHAQFSTYIYGFTWEDPQRDLEVLDLRPGDSLMVITSAGDNALAYAAHQSGLKIHCVDMNPCQNHLLELKLAALRSLDYDTFWRLFGLGSLPDFARTLDSTLSAELSSPAYQYWRQNVHAFAPRKSALADMVLGDLSHRNLYTTGYSGMALRCLRVISKLFGIHRATQQLVVTSSLAKQAELWRDKIRSCIFSNIAIRMLDNPVAMWQFMGVPINQWNMLRSEGSMSQYVRDTLDPVFHSTSCAKSNYFYHLLFARQYSPDCCPDYLTKDGFARLQHTVGNDSASVRPTFHLHTATLLDTLGGMRDGELTKAVIMDHMDWFSPEDADSEVVALARVVKKTGFVLWRSAARIPWYIDVFEKHGFIVETLDIRQPNSMKPLDRVNMYASLYKATRL